VSHSRSLAPGFLALGAEDILRTALKLHKEECDYDAKAALRDLGIDTEDL
jgi:hypothetical protein